MKRFAGRDGSKRLWYEPSEIEEIMECELAKAKLLPSVADCTVNIESFLENHLKVHCDQYAPLPDDILGLTQFRSGQKPQVQINRDLTQTALDDDDRPDWILGRWRATMAHEAAHVVLHACLFAANFNQGTLFAIDADESEEHSLHRCLKRNVLFRGQVSDWREIQANMGMAALLMPRRVFADAFVDAIKRSGIATSVPPESAAGRALIADLADRFQVSRQAAAIRIETLQLLSPQGELGLF